jgi:hypothetical protein
MLLSVATVPLLRVMCLPCPCRQWMSMLLMPFMAVTCSCVGLHVLGVLGLYYQSQQGHPASLDRAGGWLALSAVAWLPP